MKMTPRQCVVPGLIACCLAYALVAGRGGTASPHEAEPELNPPESGTELVDPSEGASELSPPAPVSELVHLEVEQGKRQRAGQKVEESRKMLQIASSSVWSKFLAKNRRAFEALRQKAAASKNGQTRCTLCDGTGHMHHCVLCSDSGECRTCFGTGKAAGDEFCPTCLGKGNCYLCRGSKGMTCPFCDDGTVDVKGPIPPESLPLE